MQTEKKRERHIYTLLNAGRRDLWAQWRVEERFEEMLQSEFARSAAKGIPQMLLCALAAQGTLAGGAAPFAPALLAAVMMKGGIAGWAAAGCIAGALIAWQPQVLLTGILLYLVYACMRGAGMRPNELTCMAVLGIGMGILPQIGAENLYERLMAAVGALASMMMAKLYLPALRVKIKERELFCTEELIGMALLAASVLAGMQGLRLWEMRPAYAALMLASLSAGYVGGAGAGAAAGGLMGLLMSVTEPRASFLMGGLVLTGLLSGLFAKMGRGWSAAGAAVAGVLAASAEPEALAWGRAAELGCAVLVFLCIREGIWKEIRRCTEREERLRRDAELTQERMCRTLCGQLEEYAALYGRMAGRAGADGGQFAAVSGALHSIAREMEQPVSALPEMAAEAARALDAAGIRAQEVQAVKEGEKLRVMLRLHCTRRDGMCDGRMVQTVSRAAGRPMRVKPTGYCPQEGLCTLEMEAASRYELNAGWAVGAKEDGQPCGDTVTAVQLPKGRYLLALADGMGHGAQAQEESRAAVEMMEDYLLAGFEPEAALHGVNEMLMKNGGAERFSTMDLMLADLDSGVLKAMKIGAVPSFIRRGRHVIRVGGDALPMGIVERVKPSVTQLMLEDNDVLLMISDGVMDAVGADEGWLQAELLKADARAPEEAARRIMEAAKKVGWYRDDMTVCIARVIRRGG